MLLKVDRVRDPREALHLEQLGVDLIGVLIDVDPRFEDDRMVSLATAAEISSSLRRAMCVGMLDGQAATAELIATIRAAGFQLVQPTPPGLPPAETRAALDRLGIGIVYGSIEVSHDDDPSWILSAYEDAEHLNATYFQLDLLPEYPEAWEFLNTQSPDFDEEIQIVDIDDLARRSGNILVGLDFSPGNVNEIAQAFPNARGLAMTLGSKPTRGDVHYLDFDAATAVVAALRR